MRILAVNEIPIFGFQYGFETTVVYMVFLAFMGAGIVIMREMKVHIPEMVLTVIFIGFIGCLLGYGVGQTEIGSYTQYKIMIEDDESYNRLIQEYEILEQDGLIFTVRERENNKEESSSKLLSSLLLPASCSSEFEVHTPQQFFLQKSVQSFSPALIS